MSPLPEVRTTRARPFENIGLDYFGPVYVKDTANPTVKRWIGLFSCLATRAIHLEVASDMSAEEFLHVFRQFAARRGTPRVVVSDNAPAFKAANQAIQDQWKKILACDEVEYFSSKKAIEWQHITEHAPWQGGVFERMVGLDKQSLRKALGRSLLTSSQLHTMMAETEAIINSRPLTYVGNEFDGTYSPLTPAHFLSSGTDLALSAIGPPAPYDVEWMPTHVPTTKQRLLKSWQKDQMRLDKVWKAWNDVYLPTLKTGPQLPPNQRKNRRTWNKPAVGEIVLVKDETNRRGFWKLGKVQELHESHDNVTRAASVKMPNGHILRKHISHLYPLELCSETALEEGAKVTDQLTTASESEESTGKEPSTTNERPRRRAAIAADARITAWSNNSEGEIE